MDSSIFSEIANFLQNNADGKKIVDQSNIHPAEMQKVAQEVIPKITDKVKNSPQTLGDLFKIFTENKEDPDSLLNSKPGFNQQKAESEGNEILRALFGGGVETEKLADETAQKTGVNVVDISSMLPMIAALATKMLGGKAETISGGDTAKVNSNGLQLNELLGFLDANKDGSIVDDLSRLGQQVMGNLLNEGKPKGQKEG